MRQNGTGGLPIPETPEEWAGLACGKSDKKFTEYMHVQDGIAYGTDKRRMHWGPSVFPDGCYDPVCFTPVSDVKEVPDFETIVVESIQYDTLSPVSIESMKVVYEGIPQRQCYRVPGGGPDYPIGHISIGRGLKGADLVLYENGGKYRIIGTSEFGSYIVMRVSERVAVDV